MKTVKLLLIISSLLLLFSCAGINEKDQKYNFDFNDKSEIQFYINIIEQFDAYINDYYFERDKIPAVKYFIFENTTAYEKFRTELRANNKGDFFIQEDKGEYLIAVNLSKGIENLIVAEIRYLISSGFRSDTPQWIIDGLEEYFRIFTGSVDTNGNLSIQFGYFNELNYDDITKKITRKAVTDLIHNYRDEFKYDSGTLFVYMSRFDKLLKIFINKLIDNVEDNTGYQSLLDSYNENYRNYCGGTEKYELKDIEQNFNCNLDRIDFENGYFFVKKSFILQEKEYQKWFESKKSDIYYDHKQNLFRKKTIELGENVDSEAYKVIDEAINRSSYIRSISFLKHELKSDGSKDKPKDVKIKYPGKVKRYQDYQKYIILDNYKWDVSYNKLYIKELNKYHSWDFDAPIVTYDFGEYIQIAGNQMKLTDVEYIGENENEYILLRKNIGRKYHIEKETSFVAKIGQEGIMTVFSDIETNNLNDSVFHIPMIPGYTIREKIGDTYEYKEYRIPYINNLTKEDSVKTDKIINEIMNKLASLKSLEAVYTEKHIREDEYDKSKFESEKNGFVQLDEDYKFKSEVSEKNDIRGNSYRTEKYIIISDGDSIYTETHSIPFYSMSSVKDEIGSVKFMKRFRSASKSGYGFPHPQINFFGIASDKNVVSFIDFIRNPFESYERKNINFVAVENGLNKFIVLKSESNLETEIFINPDDGVVRKVIEFSDDKSYEESRLVLSDIKTDVDFNNDVFSTNVKTSKMYSEFRFSMRNYISAKSVFESFFENNVSEVSELDGGGMSVFFSSTFLLRFISDGELKLKDKENMEVIEYDKEKISELIDLFPNDRDILNEKENIVCKKFMTSQNNVGGVDMFYSYHKVKKLTFIIGFHSGM